MQLLQGLMLQPMCISVSMLKQAPPTRQHRFATLCVLNLGCNSLLECSSHHCNPRLHLSFRQLWVLNEVHTVTLMSSRNQHNYSKANVLCFKQGLASADHRWRRKREFLQNCLPFAYSCASILIYR